MAEAMQVDSGHKLFVGNLPPDCSQEELQTVFSTYGEVSSVHLMAPHAKSGQRCALLFYAKQESAQDAITVLNGIYKIREDAETPIKVAWAKENEKGGGKGDGKGAEGAPTPSEDEGFKLFVGGLPADVTQQELEAVFNTYGQVTRTHIMQPHQASGRVAAFIFYATSQAGEDAIKVLDGIYKIREDADQPIQVRWGNPSKGKGKGGWDDGWGGKGGGDWNSWGAPPMGSGGKGGAAKGEEGFKLFVGGLPGEITVEAVTSVFSTYGEVNKVHLMQPHQLTGLVAAFVFYAKQESGDDAIKVLDNQYKISESLAEPIKVRWAMDKIKGGDKGKGKGKDWGWDDGWGGGKGGKGGKYGGGKAALGWDNSGGWGDSYSGGGWNSWDDGYGGKGGWQGDGWGKGGKGGDKGWGKGGDKGWGKGDKGWGKGDKGPQEVCDNRLFVGNLPEDITEEALKYVFSTYGTVEKVHIMQGKARTGQSCAFVQFLQTTDAETAIMTLHNKYEIRPGYGPLVVKKANQQRPKPY